MARTAKSTARFIAYDLRPAKQSERGILVDVLKIGGDCGLPIRTYRYIGMGANRFYDYLLLHKYLGLRKMVSLEHDPYMFERALFNVPYRFIEVRKTAVVNFLAEDRSEAPEIFWLDYDGGIDPDVVADVMSVGMRSKPGDFCFVTVGGHAPKALEEKSDADRLMVIQDLFREFAGAISIEDVERSAFSEAIHKILMAAFSSAFTTRRDGVFLPLLRVVYSDSMPMVTVGGAFLTEEKALEYRSRLKEALPFLSANAAELYHIRSFNLTERERSLFDRASTSIKKRSAERNTLKRLGFKESDFDSYHQLIRYLPRYVETIV